MKNPLVLRVLSPEPINRTLSHVLGLASSCLTSQAVSLPRQRPRHAVRGEGGTVRRLHSISPPAPEAGISSLSPPAGMQPASAPGGPRGPPQHRGRREAGGMEAAGGLVRSTLTSLRQQESPPSTAFGRLKTQIHN